MGQARWELCGSKPHGLQSTRADTSHEPGQLVTFHVFHSKKIVADQFVHHYPTSMLYNFYVSILSF